MSPIEETPLILDADGEPTSSKKAKSNGSSSSRKRKSRR
jgi:hypothetical protein